MSSPGNIELVNKFLNGRKPVRIESAYGGGVYCWVNSASDIYVGKADNFERRFKEHRHYSQVYGLGEPEFYILSSNQNDEKKWQAYAGFLFPQNQIRHIQGKDLRSPTCPDIYKEKQKMNEEVVMQKPRNPYDHYGFLDARWYNYKETPDLNEQAVQEVKSHILRDE